MKKLYVLLIISIFMFHSFVLAETLEQLVEKESGVELGECILSPKPKLKGNRFVIVIPARFDEPSVWATHTLLLVGMSKENLVQDVLEFKVPDKIYPKEVVSAECKGNDLTVRVSGKKSPIYYNWDGSRLLPATKKKQQKQPPAPLT
jgi:hypothetical protein